VSAENVEKIKHGFAALARGDIEEMLTVVHPEIELLPLSGKLIDRRTYHGHEGVREWDQARHTTWDLELIPAEYEDLGDSVLVHGEVRSRGAASGVELDTQVSWVFTFQDGKIIRLEAFLDRDEARAAAEAH
jgi:ketosteroid isomerase-like protein